MKWILPVLAFVCGVVLLFAANVKFAGVLDLVNRRLPEDRRIPEIGANVRSSEIFRLYKTYYPDGTLASAALRRGSAGLLCIAVAAVLVLLL